MNKHNFIEFEVTKAIQDGFKNQLFFRDGVLTYGADPDTTLFPNDVIKERRPCLNSENIIYRITANNGFRGFLIVHRYEGEDAMPFS